jgi:hypothetical protein
MEVMRATAVQQSVAPALSADLKQFGAGGVYVNFIGDEEAAERGSRRAPTTTGLHGSGPPGTPIISAVAIRTFAPVGAGVAALRRLTTTRPGR